VDSELISALSFATDLSELASPATRGSDFSIPTETLVRVFVLYEFVLINLFLDLYTLLQIYFRLQSSRLILIRSSDVMV
jgi:hypothetical protein